MVEKEQVTKELVEKELLEGALLGTRKLKVLLDSSNDKIALDASDKLITKAGFDKKDGGQISPQININLGAVVDALKTAKEVVSGNKEPEQIEGSFQVQS